MTKEELVGLTAGPTDEEAENKVKNRWDHIAKPLDSLGEFERILIKIGGITGTADIDISKKAVVIFCSDNGIVEEGVSQSGQEVTALVARSMAKRDSAVCKMAECVGADIKIVDIGINENLNDNKILNRKVAMGTKNFKKEPAMSEHEVLKAIEIGIQTAKDCKNEGMQILAMGEMGIGNTTTSSAVTAALLGKKASETTGRGAGISEEGLELKQKIIEEALHKYKLYDAGPLDILAAVGGFDLAGLAGLCIGGALYHIPVVMDGVISAAAVLIAQCLVPGVKDYVIASHKSKEPAAVQIMDLLDIRPVMDAGLALGEGTGAVLLLALLKPVLRVYQSAKQFQDIGVGQYTRFSWEE